MLSRSGFELNEIWARQRVSVLSENLNALHRTWQETGSPEARDAWHKAMVKAGLGGESAKIIMEPKVAAYRQKRLRYVTLLGQGLKDPYDVESRTPDQQRAVERAQHDYSRSQRLLAWTASKLGYHNRQGEFIPQEKGQHPLDHVDELAHAYSGGEILPGAAPKFRPRHKAAPDRSTRNVLPNDEAEQALRRSVVFHHGNSVRHHQHGPRRNREGGWQEGPHPNEPRVVLHSRVGDVPNPLNYFVSDE